MIYQILFGTYDRLRSFLEVVIDRSLSVQERTLTWQNRLLLVEHLIFTTFGISLFWNEDWAWDITSIFGYGISLKICIYYYLYICRYAVQIRNLTGLEKDYTSSLIHHISTILLLTLSLQRWHRVGVMIGVVHDIADIPLQMAKICHKKYALTNNMIYNYLSYPLFMIFSMVFFLTRILFNYRVINYMYLVIFNPSNGNFFNQILLAEVGVVGKILYFLLFVNLSLQIFWQLMIFKFFYMMIVKGEASDEKEGTYQFRKTE